MHWLVQWRGKYTRNQLCSRANSQFYFNIHILFLFYLAIHFRLYRVRPPSSYTIIWLDLYYISYIHTGHFLYILFHLSLSSTVFLPFLVMYFLLHFFYVYIQRISTAFEIIMFTLYQNYLNLFLIVLFTVDAILLQYF